VLRIRDDIPDADFYPSWIPESVSWISDPGSNNSTKRGRGKICCPTIFCSHKHHKIVNNFIFEQGKVIFGAKTPEIIVFFTQKFDNKLSKIWVWGTRVKNARDPGSTTLDTTQILEILSLQVDWWTAPSCKMDWSSAGGVTWS
jgi:hypothetical protein